MTNKDYENAYSSAENELKEKQINEVKEIVKNTLIELDKAKKQKEKIEEKIKYLKMDLDDLKAGKLSLIEERQEKDPKAKDYSVVIIVKEKIVREVSPWYVPYQVIWNYPSYSFGWSNSGGDASCYAITTGGCSTINNSVAKDYCLGVYDINGHSVNFR